ncbi:MAG: glycosyltransferase family 2 protein [Anaerolineae bacterium]
MEGKRSSKGRSEMIEEREVRLSVIIPLFNEEENIEPLYLRLKEVLEGLEIDYEMVIIDDGSTDTGFAILKRLHKADHLLKVVRLRRNFGQTAAFAAGFDHARGQIIVTMDADLQNDPGDIPLLLEKIEEGYDVVSGWRVKRRDPFLTRRLPSMVANFLISEVTGVRLHDYGCSLKAYRRQVVKNVHLYGELHRFIPAIASWMGISIAEVPVAHYPRRFGKSKYGLSRTIKVLLDLLTVRFLLSYSTRPIHIFGSLGLLASFVGIILGLYLGGVKFLLHQDIGSRPLLLLSILLVVIGAQMITMGLLGELVVRTYHESLDKPIYVVRELLGEAGGGNR